MINTSEDKSREKTARDAEARSRRRVLQAQIVTGLQALLEADEQLLGFSRAKIAGGLRGKLTVGFEALFAPDVNIGLTERRVVLQHVQPESGRPNEILPHSFPLSDIHSIGFSDIETFGGEAEGRLNLRMFSDQHFRLRFKGADYVENAGAIAAVFSSLTASRPMARTSPTQTLCPHCDKILDRVTKFCPYCGQTLDSVQPASVADPGSAAESPSEESTAADAFAMEPVEVSAAPEIPEPISAAVTVEESNDALVSESATVDSQAEPIAVDSVTEPAHQENEPVDAVESGHEAANEGDLPK